MPKKFDYNKAKLEMARERDPRESIIRENLKTKEELAKAELEMEKSKKQAEVDDVLYEDVTERHKKPAVPREEEAPIQNISSESQSINNEDTDDYEEPVEEEHVVKKTSSVQTASPSSNEALVSDFVNNLDNSDDEEEYTDDSEVLASGKDISVAEVSKKTEPKRETKAQSVQNDVKKQSLQKASKARGVSNDDIKVSVVKNFPTEILNTLRLLFPSAKNQTDMLTAFVYLSLGKPADLVIPDSARELLADYRGDDISNRDVQDSVTQAISQLKVADRQILQKLSAVELVCAYVLFDRLGFRKKDQKSADAVDFLENGMADLINTLEKQSEVKTMRDAQKKGTPIR